MPGGVLPTSIRQRNVVVLVPLPLLPGHRRANVVVLPLKRHLVSIDGCKRPYFKNRTMSFCIRLRVDTACFPCLNGTVFLEHFVNSIIVTPEPAIAAPTGVFYGSVYCSLGKSKTTGLHGHSNFAEVALSLFNTAIEFLGERAKTDVALATIGSISSSAVARGNGELSAYALISHPSWNGQEWNLQGYIDSVAPGEISKGGIADFKRLLELVMDNKGRPLLATPLKRASFYSSVKLGFHQVQI